MTAPGNISPETPIMDLIDPFFEAHPLTERTRQAFRTAVRSFNLHIGHTTKAAELTAAELTVNTIKGWVAGLENRHSKNQIREYRAIVRALWQFAVECGAAQQPRALWLKQSGDPGDLLAFFREHYAKVRLATAVKGTVARYEIDIQRLADYLGRIPRLSDLTTETIVGLCAETRADGRSPTTCNKIRSELVAMATFAAKRGLIPWLDSVPKQREYRRAPTAWDAAQIARLFQATAATPGEITFTETKKPWWHDTGSMRSIPAGDWWLALLAVLWDTGARIGATLRLEWSDIDPDHATVLYRAEIQKQRADQVFRLHPETINLLAAIQKPERRRIFPWPASNVTLFKHLRRILKRAGLSHTHRDLFHKIRRSVASHYKAAGGDATALLGHSGPSVTAAYLDTAICGGRQPSDVLFRPAMALPGSDGVE
jgi:integrase